MVVLGLRPTQASAYIGSLTQEAAPGQDQYQTGTYIQDGSTYAFVQNEYLYFDVCVRGPGITDEGITCHTVPRATKPANNADLDKCGKQIITPKFASNTRVGYSEKGVTRYLNAPSDPFLPLPLTSISYKLNVVNSEDPWESGNIVLTLSAASDNITAKICFTLCKLDKGDTSGSVLGKFVHQDDSDETVNWGVRCRSVFHNKLVYDEDNDPHTSASYKPAGNIAWLRTDVKYVDFPKMGHKKVDVKTPTVRAETIGAGSQLATAIINAGIGETEENAVTEVFSDSFGFAAPFALGSDSYFYNGLGGSAGHDDDYPPKVSYASDALTTIGSNDAGGAYTLPGGVEAIPTSTALWGFRYLSTQEEVEEHSTPVDDVVVQSDAQYLGVYKKSNEGKCTVHPAADKNELTDLVKTYGTIVAQYRGKYVKASDGSYEFLDGAVELSPSITASWDTVNGGYMRLEADGTLRFSPDVRLNAPTFKFYELKNTGGSSGGNAGSGGLTFAGYDVAGKCMKFNIDPKKNSTIVSISLPGNSVQIKQATIDTSGNLVFSGKLGMNLFLAKLEMQKLGYGYEGTTFKFNGVQAKGMLKVPKIDPSTGDEDGEEDAKPSILGFGGAQVTGDINTFKGGQGKDQEYYNFSFSMTVPNLFSTEATLKLVRLTSNGRLFPDVLKFKLALPSTVGLDLTPATPVATVYGLGGGIEGLASTINGNYTAIPPVVLIAEAKGQIMKVVDGWYTLKIGPSQLRFIGSNLAIKVTPDSGLKIVDKLEAGIYLNGKQLDYTGVDKVKRTYTGVTFGGDFGIKVCIFNFKDSDTDALSKTLKFFNNTITAEAALGISSTVAETTDSGQPKWVYVYLGTYGSASCSLNIPAGVKIIGGKSLLGAGISFSLGAETAFQSGQGGQSAAAFFKNAKIVGGVAATGNVGPLWGRVIYIIPKTVKLSSRVGFDEWEDVDWDEELHPSSIDAGEETPQTVLLCEPEIVVNEDGEEALALVTANVVPLAIREVTDEATVDEAAEPEAPADNEETVAAENSEETEDTPLATASVAEDAEDAAEQTEDEAAAEAEADDKTADDKAVDADEAEAVEDAANDEADEPTLTAASEDEGAEEEETLQAQDDGTFSKTFEVDSSTLPSDSVLFGLVPKKQSDLNALKDSLTVSGITLSWLPDQFDEGTHLTDNAWIGTTKSTTDANGNTTINERAVFVSLTKKQLNTLSNRVTFTASVDYDAHGLATTPVTALQASMAEGKLNASIQYPESGKEYVLYTYYGQKYTDENGKVQVSSDYLVDKREIDKDNPAAAQQINLPTTGEIAPSGSYYVASLLVEKMDVNVVDDNNVESTETAEIPVSNFQSDTQITYTNTAVAAPTNVTLVSSGNEVMKGTWKGAAGVDGYKVTIYQKDGNNWVDTGRGYNYTTEDFKNNTGLSYDSATNTYGIEMAPTVGGNGKASSDKFSDGQTINISADAAAEALPLSADTSYRIGVVGFKNTTVSTGDGDPIEYTQDSSEALSSDVFVPAYKPVVMDFALLRVNPWERTYELKKDDQGVYNGVVADNGWYLRLNSVEADGADVWSNTTVSVTPTGTLDEDGNFIENPAALSAYEQTDPRVTDFTLPDFDGTLLLEVKASYTHDGVTDETLEYVSVSKDDIVPLITLDSEVFRAGKTGAYKVTGVTDPGAKVQLAKGTGDFEDATTAAADGTFTIEGTMDLTDPTAEATSFVSCRAVDDMENTSSLASAAVSYVPAKVYTVTFNANGGSGKMNPLKVEEGKQITLPKCTFKAPRGKLFKSWNLGAPGKKITIKANTVVKAQWKPAVVKGKTYTVSGQSYKVTKVGTAKVAGTVIFVKAKNAKNIVVPATVKLADTFTYKVTVVGAKAFTGAKIRNVTVGPNVSTLTANAFNKSKATKIILKTKLLKKAGVKKCLTGSKVKSVSVKVGTKKVNKIYKKQYKKIFTKKVAGKKVKVK